MGFVSRGSGFQGIAQMYDAFLTKWTWKPGPIVGEAGPFAALQIS